MLRCLSGLVAPPHRLPGLARSPAPIHAARQRSCTALPILLHNPWPALKEQHYLGPAVGMAYPPGRQQGQHQGRVEHGLCGRVRGGAGCWGWGEESCWGWGAGLLASMGACTGGACVVGGWHALRAGHALWASSMAQSVLVGMHGWDGTPRAALQILLPTLLTRDMV